MKLEEILTNPNLVERLEEERRIDLPGFRAQYRYRKLTHLIRGVDVQKDLPNETKEFILEHLRELRMPVVYLRLVEKVPAADLREYIADPDSGMQLSFYVGADSDVQYLLKDNDFGVLLMVVEDPADPNKTLEVRVKRGYSLTQEVSTLLLNISKGGNGGRKILASADLTVQEDRLFRERTQVIRGYQQKGLAGITHYASCELQEIYQKEILESYARDRISGKARAFMKSTGMKPTPDNPAVYTSK